MLMCRLRLALLALSIGLSVIGCAVQNAPEPAYWIPPHADDVWMFVSDFDYRPALHSYTFRYNQNRPDDPTAGHRDTSAMIDSSMVVYAPEFTDSHHEGRVRFRRNWDQPTTQP
jgi:hypothetical protein